MLPGKPRRQANHPEYVMGHSINRLFMLALLAALIPAGAVAAAGSPQCRVTCSGKTMSVEARDVALDFLLKQLHRQSGLTFQWLQPAAPRKISVKFRQLSVEPAIKRILGQFNYALIAGTDLKHTKVIIYGTKRLSAFPAQADSVENDTSTSIAAFTDPDHFMQISHDSVAMEVLPPGDDKMQVTHTSAGMEIDFAPSEAMKVDTSPPAQPMDVILPASSAK